MVVDTRAIYQVVIESHSLKAEIGDKCGDVQTYDECMEMLKVFGSRDRYDSDEAQTRYGIVNVETGETVTSDIDARSLV